jgi:hypothetical protein
MSKIVNIYRNRGEWCYAIFVDGEYDCSDSLGIGDASEQEARTAAESLIEGSEVSRVADTAE